MTGVVEPVGDHFTTGASDATHTNISELVSKAVRRIWRSNDYQFQGSLGIPYGAAANHAQMLVNNNKFVIPTLFDGAGDNSEFQNITIATALTRAQQFSTAMKNTCSVVELVNEVFNSEHRVPPGPGGGKYWTFFRQAADIFHADGFEVLLSGVPNRLSFLDDAEAEDIWSYCDGVGIHCYFLNPGTNLTSPSTVLRQLKIARDKIDAFGGAAVGQPMWLTEFGWVTQKPNPSGAGGGLWVSSESEFTTKIQQAYSGFATHAETLKLKAATIFTWQDWSATTNNATLLTPFRYSGIRTNEVPPYNAPAGTDQLVGVQVAQDADTVKPTLNGTLPPSIFGDPGPPGSLTEVPGRWIRYAQGIPAASTTLASLGAQFVRDAAYMSDMVAAGKRPLACLSVGRIGTWRPTWSTAPGGQWDVLIRRWVDVLYAAGCRDFEVGNEIENPVEPYLTDYFDLLDIASPYIQAKAGANVILTSTLGPGTDQTDFLGVATARNKWGLVDGAALHPYSVHNSAAGGSTPAEIIASYNATADDVLQKITDARAAGRIPAGKDIYITEVGWGTDNGASGFTGTEAEQAGLIRALFDKLTPAFKTANRIKLICWFVYANFNTVGDTEGSWGEWCGLLRRNGTRKPSWAALQEKAGSPPNWRYKDGGGRAGLVGAKEALDSFGIGTVASGVGAAPDAITVPGASPGPTNATLRGTVDPNSLSTSYYFEYSTSPLP